MCSVSMLCRSAAVALAVSATRWTSSRTSLNSLRSSSPRRLRCSPCCRSRSAVELVSVLGAPDILTWLMSILPAGLAQPEPQAEAERSERPDQRPLGNPHAGIDAPFHRDLQLTDGLAELFLAALDLRKDLRPLLVSGVLHRDDLLREAAGTARCRHRSNRRPVS